MQKVFKINGATNMLSRLLLFALVLNDLLSNISVRTRYIFISKLVIEK